VQVRRRRTPRQHRRSPLSDALLPSEFGGIRELRLVLGTLLSTRLD